MPSYITLSDIHPFLVARYPYFDFKIKKRLGREYILAREDIFRGAEIYVIKNKIQVIPAVPTVRGRYLTGGIVNLGLILIKNFDGLANEITICLIENYPNHQIQLVEDAKDIELTEKGKRTENWIVGIFGVLIIGLSILVLIELTRAERGGEMIEMHWLIDGIYYYTNKYITSLIFALLGGWMVFSSIQGFRKNR